MFVNQVPSQVMLAPQGSGVYSTMQVPMQPASQIYTMQPQVSQAFIQQAPQAVVSQQFLAPQSQSVIVQSAASASGIYAPQASVHGSVTHSNLVQANTGDQYVSNVRLRGTPYYGGYFGEPVDYGGCIHHIFRRPFGTYTHDV